MTVACLAALLVIGAAIANSLPNLDGISLPSFDRFMPKFDHVSLPNLNRVEPPKPVHVVAKPAAPERISVPIPVMDPTVNAALKDIRSSQEQNTVVLASLTQSSATQQADLKRISRQLTALAVQVDGLAPLTTASIPHANPRARVIRTARKTEPALAARKSEPALPPPVGPVSVGGAPLSPAPSTAAAASAK